MKPRARSAPSHFSLQVQGQGLSAPPGEAAQKKPRSIRREPPPLPRALIPTDDVLKLRLAEELEYAQRILALMGDALSADPLVISRHIGSLQSIDVVSAMLGHVASVIRSSDPDGAVERIGMSDLKARLTRKSID